MENKVDWRLGKVLDDRYEIESVLGIGGMAVVYKAYDQQLGRDVAVKVLRDDVAMDAESRKQFRKEYQAVGKLSHPNIRAVYDVVVSGDTEYIVMEYVDGINLKQYMKKKGKLSWQETLDLSIQIARALSHAHSRNIVHMDIKPQNIMLPRDGEVKIADFGIAQMDDPFSGEESADEAVGSIHYISPEQARGESVDARSDIFSLGIVMYEMLTGKLPFDGETVEQVAMQHYSVVPDAPGQLDPDIPPELEGITLRAMDPDLGERYATADEMLADLEDFQQSLTAGPESAGGQVPSEVRASTAVPEKIPVRVVKDEVHVVRKNVPRISRAGELSKEGYARRRMRANRISMLLGFTLVACFAIGLFAFVWQYWLRDIFEETERVNVPSFIGLDIDELLANEAMDELYNFQIVYDADPNRKIGEVMAQDPEVGASRMVVSSGIDVTLTVSSGVQLDRLPSDIVNVPYTDAQVKLQAMGLNVVVSMTQSDSVTANYVISTDPAPGEAVVSGSTVTLYVSAGPQPMYVTMPDVVGMTKASGLLALQREGLICTEDEITYVASAPEQAGKILWQNYGAGTTLVSGTLISLTIGSGQAEAATPAPEVPQVIIPAENDGTTSEEAPAEVPVADEVPPEANDIPPAEG